VSVSVASSTVASADLLDLLLISDQSLWITGQAIAVDGGFNAGHMDDV